MHPSIPSTLYQAAGKQRGFTLIELLVSIVIIGVMIGGATLMFSNPAEDIIKEERTRLVMLFKLAQEEAIMQSREFGVGFWEQGYAFFELTDQVDENGKAIWNLLDDNLLKERELKQELELQLELEGRDILMESIATEEPQVFLFSSGEVTPFKLTLKYEEEFEVTLEADPLGKIEIGELIAKE